MTTMRRVTAMLLAAAANSPRASAFSVPPPSTRPRQTISSRARAGAAAAATPAVAPAAPVEPVALRATTTYAPVFDFTLADPAAKAKSAASFERIDDAIMGGISTSSLRDVPDESYASWSGVCRTDGGGFCGMRTLPFTAPLNATGKEGVFLDCHLASDDEAGRRVWKMTVRTDSSRGEMVYQAEYDLGKAILEECDLRDARVEAEEADMALKNAIEVAKEYGVKEEREDAKDVRVDLKEAMAGAAAGEESRDGECWVRVKVPFEDFRLVRGPRLVPDGPPLDLTGGIFQIGMTLSKFKMAQNTTELEDFRPGYFDMRIKRIGFYGPEKELGANAAESQESSSSSATAVPDTLTKEQAQSKRPLLLKLLFPIARLFFSEKANRRRSAMRILREDRGLSRGKAILFGARTRRGSMGYVPSLFKSLGIVTVDAMRATVFTLLKVVLLYPLRAVGLIVRRTKMMLGMKVKPSLRE